jgi:integrase
VIAIPPSGVALCRRRIARSWPANHHGLLFPSTSGKVRNPSNANRDLVAAVRRANADLTWVTSLTFRKTVATRLDEAGLSARQIADHLGHETPSTTQDVYMGRGVAVAEAATILGKR